MDADRYLVTGNALPAILFIAGYLAVWTAVGIPAFVASTRLNPVMHSCSWVGRVAGAVALVAGLHQLSPYRLGKHSTPEN
ncbi:copper chaperone [Mycobacterium haemophilum]